MARSDRSTTSRRRFMAAAASVGFVVGAGRRAIGAEAATRFAPVKDVNTTDIKAAVTLGCRTMSSVFNPEDGDIPFFGSTVRPRAWLGFNDSHSESHVPGRHLNALLHAESALGHKVDPSVVEKHARAAFFSFGGALPLPLNRDRVGGKLVRFLPHNLREGLHALYALARYRESAKARETAERCIDTIFELWKPDDAWDRARLEGKLGLRLVEWPGAFITGVARAIGPLVKYYAATGHQAALRLALLLKDKAVDECFLHDGSYDTARFGTHTHSTTCVMSSLAQLAELTRDAPLMERVRRFFDNGLTQVSDAIGWSIENSAPGSNPDRGEANNTGDILETALILGRWGHSEYYARAELILRAHLLPCQLRDTSFIPKAPSDAGDRPTIAERHLGAFGFPAPYGHQPLGAPDVSFNMDIVGGAVDSLCAAYGHAVTSDAAGVRVNLLFDHETAGVRVESPYTGGRAGTLRVTPKTAKPLFVRLPSWVPASGLAVEGAAVAPRVSNGYLVFTGCTPGKTIDVKLGLPRRELVLRHRTRDIRVRLQGDAVTAMDHFGTDLAYFEPIE